MPMHPLLIGVNSGDTLFFECDNVTVLEEEDLVAKDNCDDNVDVTFEEIILQGDCEQDGYYIFMHCIWTAVDDCGNQAVFEIYAKVSDTHPPMLMPLPKDVTISCEEMEPSIPMVKGEDNCTEDIIVNFNQSILPGNCPQAYTIVRTWSAEDECGNETVHTQYIHVVDQEAPVFTDIPANLTIECDDPIPSTQPEAEDNCDPQVTITLKEKEVDGPCTGTYLLLREWTATDDCGNTAVVAQQIYVEDTTPPVLVGMPADATVECDNVPDPADVKAVDACDPDAVLTYKEVRQNGNCPQSYTLIRTWTATDDCGNTTSDSQVITVRDTEAPVLGTIPANLTLECSDPIPAPPVVFATDNCDNDVQVTLSPQIIPGNCEDSYTMIRTWTATDDCGNTATGSQTISVFDTTSPEFISVPDDLEIECDEIIPVQGVSAIDNCDNDVQIDLEETKIPGQCPQEYILIRVWTAVDNCGNTATADQVIKVTDNTAPVLYPIHPILIGVSDGDTLTFPCDNVVLLDEEDMGAEDNCDPNPTISFHETEIKGDCDVDGFILQLTCTWTATDACGNSSSFHIVVRITDEVAPELLDLPANVTIECDEDLPAGNIVTAEDNCDGPVTVTMSEQIQIGVCKNNYVITRTWTATDQCGNQATASRTITVQDTTPPVFDQEPEDLTIECDQDLPDPLDINATDNCDTDPVITYKEALEPGNCPQEYTILRIWQAEDECGNSATITQKLTIVDTTAPILIGVPADETVECDEVPDPANVKAVDACDPDVDVVYNEERIDGSCPQSYTLIRTWIAVDDCGNETSDTQKITVEDTESPVFTVLPVDLTIACDQFLPAVEFQAIDNCSSNLTIDIVLEGGKACDNIPDRRIVTVTDECGNSAQAIQNILLLDTVAPFFKPYVQKLEVQCDEIIDLETPQAMDNCDEDVEVTLVEQKLPGACPQEYTLIRNWTATDDCGNTATIFQLIVVVDEVGPTLIPNDPILVGLPSGSTLQFNCEDAPALDENSFIPVDNCDPDPSITFEEVITEGDCATDGYFLQLICTWTATDACGNSSTYSITIQVTDTEAPVFVQVPADVTIGCTDDLPTDDAEAEDNCDSDLTLTANDITTDLDCGYLVTRTWTAQDDCGNQATAIQQIRVIDQDAPFFVTVLSDLTVDLDNGGVIPSPASVEADDECSDVEVTFAQTESPGNDCGQIITRIWTATDDCGNTAQLVQVITVLQACPCVLPEIDTILVIHPDCGEKNGVITVVPVGDPGSFEYVWLPNKGVPNADGNSHSGLGKGNYTILVNDPTALNCFTKVSVDLEPVGTCVDTVYVSIPQDDPYTICIEDVLDFEGNIVAASVCGQDPDEVIAIVAEGSPCVVLDPADGFTGTSTLCVIHCNDEVPEVCDTTYIVVTITTLQQPCDTIFQNSLYGYEAETCDGTVEVCIGIDPLQISDYQILVNGKAYNGQILPCGSDAVTILLKVGTWEIEVIHSPSQCSDGTSIQVTCPDEDLLIAADDQAKTKKNQAIEIAVLVNDIVPSGHTIEEFKIINSPAHGSVSIKNNQTIVYTPAPDYCGDDQFSYEICISEEVCDQADVYIDVNCNLLVIHTGFSPNGDNINDNFTIDGIEDYPNNELTVFNRWGLKIYHQKGYKNNWNGNWEDQILPDGTYFYVLKDGEGETYSGYVQIHR
ncbi:MAG: gliding motility-associated C-terminal domain-containing protein [Saprospiraceae bacterium]